MVLTLADLNNAHDDDKDEGQEFAGSEHVLYASGPAHAGTIHPSQQHLNRQKAEDQHQNHEHIKYIHVLIFLLFIISSTIKPRTRLDLKRACYNN